MFETLLVPLDGSELSEAALPTAQEMAARFGSRIILVRVIESTAQRLAGTPSLMDSPAAAAANIEMIDEVTKADREEARTYLAFVQGRLGEGCEAVVAEGPSADAILQVAQEKGAGLIVMSSHGRGGLDRLVHGSVADAVLRHGSLPVLLIRAKKAS